MRVNLLLPMAVSFLPFPTRLVAEAIRDENAERAAAIFLRRVPARDRGAQCDGDREHAVAERLGPSGVPPAAQTQRSTPDPHVLSGAGRGQPSRIVGSRRRSRARAGRPGRSTTSSTTSPPRAEGKARAGLCCSTGEVLLTPRRLAPTADRSSCPAARAARAGSARRPRRALSCRPPHPRRGGAQAPSGDRGSPCRATPGGSPP
jgi:hypothetical protein